MRLEAIKELKEIDTLHKLKPLTRDFIIASQMDVIYLGANLLLTSNLLMRGEIKSNKTDRECSNEAIKIMKIIKSYDTKYLTVEEVAKVRRDYKLIGWA